MTIKRLSVYKNRYSILRKTSKEATRDFENNHFDFVYIDGDHRYEYVKEDLAMWFPKVKIGGVFAGHDYWDGPVFLNDHTFLDPAFFGVKKAVDEFFKEREFFVTQNEEWHN